MVVVVNLLAGSRRKGVVCGGVCTGGVSLWDGVENLRRSAWSFVVLLEGGGVCTLCEWSCGV